MGDGAGDGDGDGDGDGGLVGEGGEFVILGWEMGASLSWGKVVCWNKWSVLSP